ncbi:MAG TPA: RES family NAD+ phosphorylase, partial [Longimicrobium sp.]|nr:RES family NAD+ phosphorylase [Longimicrobium sp.]
MRSVAPGYRQTGGRFDLVTTSVLYLAETPAHGVAEVLRRFTGGVLSPALLRLSRHPLALVEVGVPLDLLPEIADLGDPRVLLQHGVRPDTLALPESERTRTQEVSRRLHAAGLRGFRWWSAIHGGWHSTVLFVDRVPLTTRALGTPELLTVCHPGSPQPRPRGEKRSAPPRPVP